MTKTYYQIKLVNGQSRIIDQEDYDRIKKKGVLVFTHIKQWIVRNAA